jgi:ribosomal protein S18 acetylase RimI-like enzyme
LSPITIRPWAQRDRDAVQSLLSLLGPEARVVAGDAPTYVAEADGQVVGMVTVCVFTTLTGRKAYLDHLVVAREWRRRGVARDLVRHAVEVATAAGASRLDLTAGADKVAARTLYASLGFRERETGSFRLPLAADPRQMSREAIDE